MERDEKDDSVDPTMLMPMISTTTSTQNIILSKPSNINNNNNYTALLENEESFLQGILSGGGEGMQSASINKSNQIGVKRQQPSSSFWNEAGPMVSSGGGGKRFHGDLNSSNSTTTTIGGGGTGISTGEMNNSSAFVSILNQTASFHHQNGLLGSVNDGVLRPQFQLPSMNWNS